MRNILNNILARSEGKTLEFKRDSASPTLVMKTLVAFANTAGGHLVIGIGDDRQIVGVKAPLDEEERLRSLIADSITPHLVPNIELVTIHDTTLLVIEVFVSALRPHWLKAEGHEQGVYVRIGSSNCPADTALIAELGRSAEGISYDEMPMPELSKDDLDLAAVQKCFAGNWKLDEQALVTIKLLTSYQRRLVPTRGAVLLFGKERALHFSDAWIQCSRFTGGDRAVLFDSVDIYDHLPLAVESAMDFLGKFASAEASRTLTLLREAVINALLHADYSLRRAPIRIAFFDDRIEIENPGILLPGMTIEAMRQGTSRIRNHVIARVFRELNLVERWGSGIHSIYQDAEALGLHEPQIMEVGMRIRLTVALATPVSVFAKKAQVAAQVKTTHWAQDSGQSKAQDGALTGIQVEAQGKAQVDLRILSLCATKPLSSAEIAAALGHKQLSGNLRKALPRLRESGLLDYTIPEKPNSRSQKYRLTAKGKTLL
ncbi:MAG: ATP-binding protein [Chlorobium sp.]